MPLELFAILQVRQDLPPDSKGIHMSGSNRTMMLEWLQMEEEFQLEVVLVQPQATPIKMISKSIGCKTKLSRGSLLYLPSLVINLLKTLFK